MEFAARVLVQIPDGRRHLARYYGFCSNAARGKRKKAAAPAEPFSPGKAPGGATTPDGADRAALRRQFCDPGHAPHPDPSGDVTFAGASVAADEMSFALFLGTRRSPRSFFLVMTGDRRPLWRDEWLLGYAALYVVLLLALHLREGFGLAEPLLVLAIVGVAFSALAWWSTRRASAHAVPVRAAGAECGVLAAYLLLVVVPFLATGTGVVRRSVADPRGVEVALLALKLAVFVAIPFALFRSSFHYSWREFVDTHGRWDGHGRAVFVMALALVSFQSIFGRGLAELRGAAVSAAPLAAGVLLAFLWLVFEVGLVEEFFFRALVQSRLAALLRSEVAAVVLMALLFGLAHAPGMYLRPAVTQEALGPTPSLLGAIGYSVVITSVTGFFLGVLWARTRNLLALMLVHAAGDLVPNLLQFLRTWGLASPAS